MTHLRKHLVVVGHGMVGHRFVQAAIERGLTETHDITVIGEERLPAYDRVALTSFFEVGADALSLLPISERINVLRHLPYPLRDAMKPLCIGGSQRLHMQPWSPAVLAMRHA